MFEVQGNADLKTSREKLADVRLSYRLPEDSTLRAAVFPCSGNYAPLDRLDKPFPFAAAVALYGMILRESKFAQGVNFGDVLTLANLGLEPNNSLETDFIHQVDKTIKIYGNKRKKHGDD
jgi:Ca-activated chloride channel family protein